MLHTMSPTPLNHRKHAQRFTVYTMMLKKVSKDTRGYDEEKESNLFKVMLDGVYEVLGTVVYRMLSGLG